MSDKLSSNLGTTEIQTVQSRMYPFDAWESENASRYSQPKIKVLEPYKLYASYRPTVHSVSSDNYTITDIDGYDLILVTTGADARTITLPTVADNTDRIIKVMKADSGAGKVVLDGEGAEAIIQIGGTSFATMEMFYQGDFIEVISDGTSWLKLNACELKKIPDPPTGHKSDLTSGWTSDDFNNSHEITFSEVAVGSLWVVCSLSQFTTSTDVYARASGDSNISNTPHASEEYSQRIADNSTDVIVVTLQLNSEKKTQLTVLDTGTDIYLEYPKAFYI